MESRGGASPRAGAGPFAFFGGGRVGLVTTRPRGTEDILPAEAVRWRHVDAVARQLGDLYGDGEIRTPIFARCELIHRVGNSTDVAQKETYEFTDRSGRKLTLRPEGTAPVTRARLQANLFGQGLSVKVCYVNYPAFRYERPQARRPRQHHQFGCEVFGVPGPEADAELILLLADFLSRSGVTRAEAHLGSIGYPVCRPRYREALRAYYGPRLQEVCADCRRRYDQNQLRLLDCKVDLALSAPRSVDYLCDDCQRRLDGLGAPLSAAGLPFTLDPLLVLGFDYYTRAVFEFVHQGPGAQSGSAAVGGTTGWSDRWGGRRCPRQALASG